MGGVSDASGILVEALLKHTKTPRPLTREEYTLKALEGAFPSGEWLPPAEAPGVEEKTRWGLASDSSGSNEGGQCLRPPSIPSLTIIGGTKYDEQALDDYLSDVEYDTQVYTGDGRGAETWVSLRGDEDYGLLVIRVRSAPDVYGKNARKVNVEQVLSYDPFSRLLLVGSGERVKQAESWLKRANWGREVIRLP